MVFTIDIMSWGGTQGTREAHGGEGAQTPACRHRQQPTPRDHQEPASGEGSGHTDTPASCKPEWGPPGSTQGLGEQTPWPEWQGLEVPGEQPLTPRKLD